MATGDLVYPKDFNNPDKVSKTGHFKVSTGPGKYNCVCVNQLMALKWIRQGRMRLRKGAKGPNGKKLCGKTYKKVVARMRANGEVS